MKMRFLMASLLFASLLLAGGAIAAPLPVDANLFVDGQQFVEFGEATNPMPVVAGVSYDPTSNVLSLNNYDGGPIVFGSMTDTFVLRLAGTNRIAGKADTDFGAGIRYMEGPLTIQLAAGSATTVAGAPYSDQYASGLYGSSNNAVIVDLSVSGNGALTVTGADSDDTSGGYTFGIRVESALTVSGGSTVTGIGGNVRGDKANSFSTGIYARNGITVSGGSLTGRGGTASTSGYASSYGIWTRDGKITLSSGKLEGIAGDVVSRYDNPLARSVGITTRRNSTAKSTTVTVTGGHLLASTTAGNTATQKAAVEDLVVSGYAGGGWRDSQTASWRPVSSYAESTPPQTYIEVKKITIVGFDKLTADGSDTQTTTKLTLTLDRNMAELSADDLTVTGATKGLLSKSSTNEWMLKLSNITVADKERVTVAITKENYDFQPSSRDVVVRKLAINITTQPASQRVTVGHGATFAVAATGDTLRYQWLVDRNDGLGWQKLTGETAASYTIPNVPKVWDGNRFICEIIDVSGKAVMSNVATLRVSKLPPDTGDAAATPRWGFLCLLGGAGLLAMAFARRRKRRA